MDTTTIVLSNISNSFLSQEEGGEALVIPAYMGLYIAVTNIAIFTAGLVCNVLVILVQLVFTHSSGSGSMGHYLVNLGVADLCVLLVCQPVATIEFFTRARWFLGPAVCKMVPILESTVQHASTLTILAITVERMTAVCKPLVAFTTKQRRSRFVIPLIWLISITLASPFAGIAKTMEVQFTDGTFGTTCSAPLDKPWKGIFVVAGIALFFLLIIVMGLMHVRIIGKLRRSAGLRRSSTSFSIPRSNSSLSVRPVKPPSGLSETINLMSMTGGNSSNEKNTSVTSEIKQLIMRQRSTSRNALLGTAPHHSGQITRLIFIVVFLFVSYMPMRIFILWQMYSPAQPTAIGVERYLNLIWACRLLLYLHSASNPFIYSFMSSKFMHSFKRLVNGDRRRKGQCINSLLLSQVNMALPGCRPALDSQRTKRLKFYKTPNMNERSWL